MKKTARSVIKWVDIQAPFNKTYDFLSNPINWPAYAVVNLRTVIPGQNGWFKVVTKYGEGSIKMNAVNELGIFDHTWQDPQATWEVYSRVVPNGGGSTVMMTLFQPSIMSNQEFDQAMKEMDLEFAKLKEILEQ